MPTYEYRCSSCGEQVDIVHSIHAGPPETCPACGGRDTLRKSFAPPAIVFKGTGWAKKERSSRPSSGSGDGETPKSGEPVAASGDGTKGDASDGSSEASAATTSARSGGGDRAKTAAAGG